MSLMSTPLTFITYTASDYDVAGKWVDGGETPVDAIGALQPYRSGTFQETLPEGVTANDARIFYTKTKIGTSNHHTDEQAPKTTIDGITYIVMNSEDWSTLGSRIDHYKLLLVRVDADD